jgi:dolichol kinase
MIHMCPGLLPGFLLAIPHPDPLAWYSQALIIAVVSGMSVFALRRAKLFERQNETGWAMSVVSYAVIVLTMLVAFPAQPEMGLVVTVIIAFGDGSATLGGLLLQGPRLPWNSDKSWAGFSAFLLISIPLAAVVYWGEARPGVSLSAALACVAPACLAAAVAESLPMRLNDNIRVGVTSALAMFVTSGVFVE